MKAGCKGYYKGGAQMTQRWGRKGVMAGCEGRAKGLDKMDFLRTSDAV